MALKKIKKKRERERERKGEGGRNRNRSFILFPEEGPPSYGFIDILGTNMKQDNIWFSDQYSKKHQRDALSLLASNEHRAEKEAVWQKFLQDVHIFWVDRLIWEIMLVEAAWGRPGVQFLTDKSFEEIKAIGDPELLEYPRNFWEQIDEW